MVLELRQGILTGDKRTVKFRQEIRDSVADGFNFRCPSAAESLPGCLQCLKKKHKANAGNVHRLTDYFPSGFDYQLHAGLDIVDAYYYDGHGRDCPWVFG